ncbi:MAG: hypothetical protein K2W92_07855 [Alphaproteobacteria bacterium]|nr:hypothetical protein [Alphaproteobacteria bacterium]
MNETDLTLEIVGKGEALPLFSARECIQTLTLAPQDSLRRTINGHLVSIGHKTHRKFHSTVSCKDKIPPAFGELWTGTLVKVGCLQSLTQTVPQGSAHILLERDAVSVDLYDEKGSVWPVDKGKNRLIDIHADFPGGFLTYRPLLRMVVKNYCLETDEWGLSVGWSLELEEE